MEEVIGSTGGNADEMVNELLDDESPFLMLPRQANFMPPIDSQLPSAGPTIEDIGNASSYSRYGVHNFHHEAKSEAHRISMLERDHLNKANHENKYTLRIKSCGDAMADDGHKWRKYGQKSIKNSPYLRSYYRCTNPRCSAKKQVERSIDDPDTLIVTYEGLHLHFTYPYLLHNNNQHRQTDPSIKKQKGPILHVGGQAGNGVDEEILDLESSAQIRPAAEFKPESMGQEGLLEDVVPLTIRNPLANAATSMSSSSASHESHPSSPVSFKSFS